MFIDTFQRIVLRNEPVRAVLDAQAEVHAADHDGDRRAVLGARQAQRRRLPGEVSRRSAPHPGASPG